MQTACFDLLPVRCGIDACCLTLECNAIQSSTVTVIHVVQAYVVKLMQIIVVNNNGPFRTRPGLFSSFMNPAHTHPIGWRIVSRCSNRSFVCSFIRSFVRTFAPRASGRATGSSSPRLGLARAQQESLPSDRPGVSGKPLYFALIRFVVAR